MIIICVFIVIVVNIVVLYLIVFSTDVYWPVSLVENKLMVAICKGGFKYPATLPRPILSEIDIEQPFIELDKIEIDYVRNDVLWSEQMSVHALNEAGRQDAVILRLLAKSCKDDKNSRSLDLCTMLKIRKSLEIAITLVNKFKKPNLAQRINMLLQAKFPSITTAMKEEVETAPTGTLMIADPNIKVNTNSPGNNNNKRKRLSKGAPVHTPEAIKTSRISIDENDDGEAEFDVNALSSSAEKENKKVRKDPVVRKNVVPATNSATPNPFNVHSKSNIPSTPVDKKEIKKSPIKSNPFAKSSTAQSPAKNSFL
jgi:hypothetical protein